MVIGTTRRPGQVSIITGTEPGPASSARNSVWPGWRKPASIRTCFWIGLVTSAEAAPDETSRTPCSIAAMTAAALTASGRPGTTGPASGIGRTGRAEFHAASASRTSAIGLIGTDRRSNRASAPNRAGSSSRAKQGTPAARRDQAANASSPPIPAGSPMVRTRGGMIGASDAQIDEGDLAQIAQIAAGEVFQARAGDVVGDPVALLFGVAALARANHEHADAVAHRDRIGRHRDFGRENGRTDLGRQVAHLDVADRTGQVGRDVAADLRQFA